MEITSKQTPMQQIKSNYYKMDEVQFHNWIAQNLDALLKEEKCLVIEGYEAGHSHRESDVFKLRSMLTELYNGE